MDGLMNHGSSHETHHIQHTHPPTHPPTTNSLCRDIPAWGAYRGATYASHGLMKNLVCCDGPFRCSPYQPNSVPVRPALFCVWSFHSSPVSQHNHPNQPPQF